MLLRIRTPHVAAGADDRQPRHTKLDLLDQFTPAHLRHHQIRDDEINHRLAFHEHLQRLGPAAGRDHAIAKRRQNRLARAQQQFLVIHHQHGFVSDQLRVARAAVGDALARRGQIDAHRGPLSRLTGDRHSAAMVGDDAVEPGQPKTAMPLLGGEERLKNLRQHLGRNPPPVIRELDADIRAGLQLRGAILRRLGDVQVARADADATCAAQSLHGIIHNPGEGLLHLALVELDRVKLALQLQRPRQLRRLVLVEGIHHAAQHRVEIPRRVALRFLLVPAEGGKLIGDFRGALRGLLHLDQGRAARMIPLDAPQHERGVPEHAGERVVEIQRDRARQLHRAIQLLLVRERLHHRRPRIRHRIRHRVQRRDRRGRDHWDLLLEELKDKALLPVQSSPGRANVGGERHGHAALAAKLDGHHRMRRTLPAGDEVVGALALLGPKCGEHQAITLQLRPEEFDRRLVRMAQHAARLHHEGGPASAFQRERRVRLHARRNKSLSPGLGPGCFRRLI